MPLRLNLLCNGTYRPDAHRKWTKNFDTIQFPGAPKRDEFGIIIKEEESHESDEAADSA